MIIIRNRFIPLRGFIALTLWPFIFVRRDEWPKFTAAVRRHERIHGRQQVELLLVGTLLSLLLALGGSGWWSLLALPLFFWLYGLEWLVGLLTLRDSNEAYKNISFEQEAYDNELDPDYLTARKPFAWLRYIRHPRRAFVLMAIASLFTSCTTTRTVTVERVRTDTVRITQLQRDSIFRHDSIYVRERTQGDTVIMEVDRWHTQYRDRLLIDTCYISRRDSVPVPYPVEKRVPAQLSGWQNFQLWLGRLLLIALALCATVFAFRWWLRVKKVI